MTLPLIAVTAMASERIEGLRFGGHAVSAAVLQAIARTGAVPVLITSVSAAEQFPLERFSGLVVPGGGDIDPSLYGGDPALAHGTPNRVQDIFEIELLQRAIGERIPVFAICRGMQVLNVALGGDLVGDLPVNVVPYRKGYHDVTLDEGSLVARAVGGSRISVSTYHHQALGRLGAGLAVVGRADDGCIEAVSHEEAPVLAVQWHPEDDAAENAQDQGLFDRFVDMCVAFRRG
ncbi:gamma-glutamyl-gamma-aminobutyrate hydrolase family protein [Leucobacter sp. Z1108]|uniref:gamma-glutamyl-gamma-aminobutyrate hydrolase family protein n=1 Tax=Leucobacter sp. Z1108 TaxID=3439066 RepID=UPI003F419629